MDLVTELQRLSDLHHSGALTADEFSAAKAVLLHGRSGAEAGADHTVDDMEGAWTQTYDGADSSPMPDDLPAGHQHARSGRLYAGIVVALVGLFWISWALNNAVKARSLVDAMGPVAGPGMLDVIDLFGATGDVVYTDPNGQRIELKPTTDLGQPIRQRMLTGIARSAVLDMLLGLVIVVAGVWLGMGGRRGVITFQTSVPALDRGGLDLTDRQGDG